MKSKLIIFIVILAVIAGIAGFLHWQSNIYSKEVLKLEILGPEKAELLQEVEYLVKYKNNGNVRLEEPQLIFEYPEYSLPSGEKALRQTLGTEELGGAIYPGEEKTLHFKARLLGKENQALAAKVSLTYRPKNLQARYESATTFTTIIEKVPLTFEFDLASQIESGKELSFRLNYFSNIDYPLPELRIMVEYPSGFEFIESNLPSLEKTEWEIGLLNKAEGGRIEISGKIFGEIGEEKVFQAKIGSWQDGEFILLKEIAKGIEIVKPSLYISQQINGNPQYIASPGGLLHYEVFFKNIGEELLNNLVLVAKLEGKAFDFETLRAPQGSFESGDNSIIFDWKRVPKLQFLDANEEGAIDFWIELKEEWEIAGSGDKNPVIKNKIYLSQVREEFTTKVNSKLVIEQKGYFERSEKQGSEERSDEGPYFEDEIFGNSGPIPPRTGEITTYTIMWKLKNFYNDVDNVKVKVDLPKNVELTGKIFPEEESEKFAFDSQSREIVWEAGDLKMSQGVAGTPTPNISFQVRFRPDGTQGGQTPDIVGEAKISGQDQWTGASLKATAPPVNTTLPDDETISEQQGIVQ